MVVCAEKVTLIMTSKINFIANKPIIYKNIVFALILKTGPHSILS